MLRRANAILNDAAVYFAQDLDPTRLILALIALAGALNRRTMRFYGAEAAVATGIAREIGANCGPGAVEVESLPVGIGLVMSFG